MRDYNLKLSPFHTLDVLSCHIKKCVNDHMRFEFCGLIQPEDEENFLKAGLEDIAVELSMVGDDGSEYQAEYLKAKERYDALNGEARELLDCGPANPMFAACRPFYQSETLTEDLIQALITKITVYDGNRLDIQLVYQDEFLKVASFLEGVTGA